MEGVVIYFGNAALQEVCGELCAKPSEPSAENAFTTFPYVDEGWKDELEPSELLQLVEVLGSTPTCAVHIACRHGQPARDTLTAVAMVMSKFPNSVLDDDFDGLWSSAQVISLAKKQPPDGLYALRKAG
ncbi:MAG TPA: hypothetical protein VGE47_10785 [Burkholderiaceae bacterium]